MPSEHFTTCLDLGHACLTGYDPAKFILGLGDKLGYVHLHDNDGIKDDHTLPGIGIIQWEKVRAALQKIGYQGVLCYEILGYFKNLSREETEDALKRAFKVGKELLC